jgi:hypothetical protein
MRMIPANKTCHWLIPPLVAAIVMLSLIPALAGPYLDSAHGNNSYGVDRASIDSRYADYATGNCAHCHEMHASLEGTDPAPATGASAHTLFAPGFNTGRTLNPYVDTYNFCFYCHGVSGPAVTNQDYSAVFGGAAGGSGPQSINEAFNQASYHNLNDIRVFLENSPTFSTWFAEIGNPCSACHNSHLAKRNWDIGLAGFPLLSAISRPGDSDTLWGETELMSSHFGYEAPFDLTGTSREPAGLGDADGTNTPDYVGFCTTCHNATNIIMSTTLGRPLKNIDWGNVGDFRDQHGPIARDSDGVIHLREPYATAAAVKSNFFMSCLDCHEAHGSENTMLLRRRINGEDLEGPVVSTDTMSYVCKRCHTDDLAAAAGTGEADRWEFVHHLATDAPYSAPGQCGVCHVSGAGGDPIACGNCHGHGMDDSWAPTQATGRKTF